MEKTHKVKKYEYTNPKHKKYFRQWNIKAFPTIIIAKGDVKVSKSTGYRTKKYILRLKGANDALKKRNDGGKCKPFVVW